MVHWFYGSVLRDLCVRPIRQGGRAGCKICLNDLTVQAPKSCEFKAGTSFTWRGFWSRKHLFQVHFLFDRHQIMESDGAETESLFTGPEALKTVDSAARIEILHLFPELASIDYDRLPDPVRPILSGRQGRKLANRHANNKKHLAQ